MIPGCSPIWLCCLGASDLTSLRLSFLIYKSRTPLKSQTCQQMLASPSLRGHTLESFQASHYSPWNVTPCKHLSFPPALPLGEAFPASFQQSAMCPGARSTAPVSLPAALTEGMYPAQGWSQLLCVPPSCHTLPRAGAG